MTGIWEFDRACENGDEVKVKRLARQDPTLLNQLENGFTGLMSALIFGHHSIARWLLKQPGLDIAVTEPDTNRTALHQACMDLPDAEQAVIGQAYSSPLDIVVWLAKLSGQQVQDQQDVWGDTALDQAVTVGRTSANYLFLSWLGAAGKPENKRADPVTVHSWIQAGLTKDAQLWALAAKDTEALKFLARMDKVTIDWEELRKLDELIFNGEMSLSLFHLKNPLVKFYEEEIGTNFKVVCQGRELRCHKEILAARSEFFRGLVDTDLPESREKVEMVVCPDPEVAKELIR